MPIPTLCHRLVIAIHLENNALPDFAPLLPNNAGRLSAFKPSFFPSRCQQGATIGAKYMQSCAQPDDAHFSNLIAEDGIVRCKRPCYCNVKYLWHRR
jgi:hypothetical protein